MCHRSVDWPGQRLQARSTPRLASNTATETPASPPASSQSTSQPATSWILPSWSLGSLGSGVRTLGLVHDLEQSPRFPDTTRYCSSDDRGRSTQSRHHQLPTASVYGGRPRVEPRPGGRPHLGWGGVAGAGGAV